MSLPKAVGFTIVYCCDVEEPMFISTWWWYTETMRKTEMWRGVSVPLLGVLVQGLGLIFHRDCLFVGSVGAHRALRECQEWPASDSCCMRSMSAYKPSVAVLHYQVLWQQVA